MTFNEEIYLVLNPDVAAAVNAESFSSGVEHYTQFGQYELSRYYSPSNDLDTAAYFTGTNGNDIVTGFGVRTVIYGVYFDIDLLGNNYFLGSGAGEVDTLIGGSGSDNFYLGNDITSQPFYVGGGSADYALIQNFNTEGDYVALTGKPSDYNLQAVNGSLNISTSTGDLIALVEGVPFLDVTGVFPDSGPLGQFLLG